MLPVLLRRSLLRNWLHGLLRIDRLLRLRWIGRAGLGWRLSVLLLRNLLRALGHSLRLILLNWLGLRGRRPVLLGRLLRRGLLDRLLVLLASCAVPLGVLLHETHMVPALRTRAHHCTSLSIDYYG